MTDPTERPAALRPRDLVIPLGVGVALRLLFVVSFLGTDLAGDERAYSRLGGAWHEFGAYTGIWAPLYARAFAVVHALVGDAAPDAMRFLHLGLAVWIGAWTARIAAMFGGRRAGVAAAWVYALYLPLVGYCALLFSETVFLSLFVPAIHQLLRLAREGRAQAPWWRAPLAGSLVGLAALTRESTALFVVPCALWIAFALRGPRPALWTAASFALTAALCVLPWTIRNLHTFGTFVPVGISAGANSFVGWNAYDANFDLAGLTPTLEEAPGRIRKAIRGAAPEPWVSLTEGNDAHRSRANVELGLSFAAEHPVFFARGRIVEFVDLLSPLSYPVRSMRLVDVGQPLASVRPVVAVLTMLCVPLLLLMALQGWATARHAGPLRSLAATMVLCTSAVALVNGISRYRLPVVPVLIALAALYLSGACEAPTAAARRVRLVVAVVLVLAWIPSLEPTLLSLAALM
ncbi:MAG: hypothetical protein AAF957_29160 [Planctomycetota bacterium]